MSFHLANSNSAHSSATGDASFASRMRFGEFEVNFTERELHRHGVRVKLQNKPFQILEFLLRRPGSLVTRAELAKALWPDLHVSYERCLNTAVNSLREALGDSRLTSRFVETCPGLGYRFISPVEVQNSVSRDVPNDKPSSAAHRDYLTGMFFFNKMSDEGLTTALAHFTSAIELDATYGLPYAGLARIYNVFAWLGVTSPKAVLDRAYEYATSAQWLAPDQPEPYVAMAGFKRIFEWDWAASERLYKKATALDPSCEAAHMWYADLLLCQGRREEAQREVRLALNSNPVSLWANYQLALILYSSGTSRPALEQTWRTLVLDPHFAPGHHLLGLVYHQMEMNEDACLELESACDCSSMRPAALGALGYLHATTGASEKARKLLDELIDSSGKRYVPAYWCAVVNAGLGETDASLNALEKAYEDRDVSLQRMADDWRLDRLREHPRFHALLVKAKLPTARI